MKQRIEAALAPLVGLPMTDCWRPSVQGFEAMQRFEFGVQRPATNDKGKQRTFGDYALDVGCPWRIVGQDCILAAYIDLYFPVDNPTESGSPDDFDSYAPGASQRDRQIQHFVERLADAPLIVESLTADAVGSVYITLSREYKLEILPMDSLPFEFWRLLNIGPKGKRQAQFVVTGQGIQE